MSSFFRDKEAQTAEASLRMSSCPAQGRACDSHKCPYPGKGPLFCRLSSSYWNGGAVPVCTRGVELRKRYANSDQRQQTQRQLLLLGETGTSDIGWPGMTSGGRGQPVWGLADALEADRWTDWSKHWENLLTAVPGPGCDHLTDLTPHHQLLPSPFTHSTLLLRSHRVPNTPLPSTPTLESTGLHISPQRGLL